MWNYCTNAQGGGGATNIANNNKGRESNLAKIFISVLNIRLLDWFSANDVISDATFGFKPGLVL